MEGWEGRVAIVTGAGGGLGKDYALALARRGVSVVVNDIGCSPIGQGLDNRLADDVAGEINNAGGRAVSDFTDAGERSAGRTLVERALDSFGRLDIVINNAGITGGGPFGQLTEEAFDQVVEVSLGSTTRLVRAAWPHLAASGAGRVVNITSHSTFGHPYTVAYATAKSAIAGFTRCLGRESVNDNIMVNCIMPSAFTRQTALIREDEEKRAYRIREHGIERVTPLAVALASTECRVSGEVFHAGGSLFARVGMGMSTGITDFAPTPEAILLALDTIVAQTDLEDLRSSDEAIAYVHRRAAQDRV